MSTAKEIRQSMRKLGLFTPHDVSRWGHEHGMSPLYIQTRPHWKHEHAYSITPQAGILQVLDYRNPVLPVKEFRFLGETAYGAVFKTALAWVEAKFDIPMKRFVAMNAAFAQPVTEVLEDMSLEIIEVATLDRLLEEHLLKKEIKKISAAKQETFKAALV